MERTVLRLVRIVAGVAAPDLGPWMPLEVDAVIERFASAPFRWWISGGRALDLHLGRGWREHDDTDVGIVRSDAPLVRLLLSDWDLHVAAAGLLTPWAGEPLDKARHQNNVWCRPAPDGPWVLDLTIGEGTDANWVYKRDASIELPWEVTVLRTAEGVPYLAPEVQLLFKSKTVRPKDDVDARTVIPELDHRQRSWLSTQLGAEHPWQLLLE